MLADLYLLPNTTTPYRYVNNGSCVSNLNFTRPSLGPKILASRKHNENLP